ncbi:pentapeptide repeat-containing protein [Nocardia cyriacigeorgica]|uniref:pentapeptide repeat-containing protein n=1 Tax=Nocardia cyriacigeorgica TaxID=135487 RepID=UPI0024541603|nr:pentapeptide repeat-containing protein [Nocardia cyriacigeorgica]
MSTTALTRTQRVFAIIGGVVAIAAIIWLVYQVPAWLTRDVKEAEGFRTQLVQLIGFGIAGAVAVYGIKKHYLDRDKQYTDSYSAAVSKLGSADSFLRAGGARELERIMDYTPADQIRVVETYADFLRHHSATSDRPDSAQRPAADVTAVLAALRRRRVAADEPTLDLSRIQVPNADMRGMRLPGADLSRSNLNGADLTDATLTDADLTATTFNRADLSNARLCRAKLIDARFVAATLRGADLTGADMTGCALKDADLRGADLREVRGLTAEQLADARTDATTRLPDHLA